MKIATYSKPHMQQFLLVYGITLGILFGIVWFIYQEQIDGIKANLVVEEAAKIRIATHALELGIQSTISDLKALGGSPALLTFLEQDTPATRQHVEEMFRNFANSKKTYDQIRYLDADGLEVIRINYDAQQDQSVIIPKQDLQDKQHRYYFQDAWKLAPEEVYISPLDLNIEQEQIERPFKPMLRLAMPIADDNGEKRGVIVLNYRAAKVLQQFREQLENNHAMLLNQDGFWLSSPTPKDEWGFMFEQKPRFDTRYPKAWTFIQQHNAGDIRVPEGIFVFTTVYPLRSGQHTSLDHVYTTIAETAQQEWQAYYWKTVSLIPNLALPTFFNRYSKLEWTLTTLVLICIAYLEWMLLASLHAYQRSLENLKENEQQLREITDTLAEGLYVLNDKGIIEFVNKEACQLLGLPRENLLGHDVCEVLHARSVAAEEKQGCQEHCTMFKALLNKQHYRDDSAYFPRANGNPFPVLVSASPIIRNGVAIKSVVAFHDITDMKQSEEALQNARQVAENANRAKSLFLTNMSHELRTPLNAILGFARILFKAPEVPKSVKPKLKSIQHASEHLLSLINDILDLSKIEAGKVELSPKPMSPNRFFDEIVDIIRFRVEQKALCFEYTKTDTLPEAIYCDPKRLRQVLLNLLGNATKFTESGTVTLDVAYDNKCLLLTVSDTGIGIPHEQLGTIFQPFVQTGDARYKSQGTGLGLTITHKIITLMHGELTVTSSIGSGTQVNVKIPITSIDASQLEAEIPLNAEAVIAYQRTDGHRDPLRVLVVDDIATNRQLLCEMLGGLGFELMEADSGQACLQYAPRFAPDIVLLDMRMQDFNGLETMRRLHALPTLQELPVIMVSASVYEEDLQAALNKGAVAYISKPITPEELLKKLARHLPLTWQYQDSLTELEPQNVASHYPPTWLMDLQQAVIEGDTQAIRHLLSQREQQDGTLDASLAAWAEAYDYEKILDWIELKQ